MAKISINIPDDMEEKIRKYAKEENQNLTNTCIILLNKGLEFKEDNISLEKYEKLKKDYGDLKINFEKERTERLKVLENYKNFNNQLLELMKADRILQIEQKQKKEPLLKRVKIFFLGEEK